MIDKLLTALRNLVLPRMVTSMALQPARTFPLEPETPSPEPDADTWLLEKERNFQSEVSNYTGAFTRLSDRLSDLHSIASQIASVAPAAQEVQLEAGIQAVVWSDTDLFDGEAALATDHQATWLVSEDADLFEDYAGLPIPPIPAFECETRALLHSSDLRRPV
ncbi:MAG: hypothetical protein AAF950_09165 [Pseudomonadota bacterium]